MTAAVVVMLATTDLIFAIDSIPAIFAMTDDTFIVFAANAFALLGLRSLYFLLAGMMDRFAYLTHRPRADPRVRRSEDAPHRRLEDPDLAVAPRDPRDPR